MQYNILYYTAYFIQEVGMFFVRSHFAVELDKVTTANILQNPKD